MNIEFKHICIDKNDWLDSLPCEAIAGIAIEAYAGFIPVEHAVMLLGGTAKCDIYDAAVLRGIAHGYEYSEGTDELKAIRKTELEECSTFARKLNDEWDGFFKAFDEEGNEGFANFNDEDQNLVLGPRLLAFLRENRRSGGTTVELALSSGRLASEMVIVSAAALVQCEQAAVAYLSNDIKSFAQCISEVQSLTMRINGDLASESVLRRAQLGARVAHKGTVKGRAMAAIRVEFDRWQDGKARYTGRPQFAIKMHLAHPDVTADAIKNNCVKWHKERKSSS